MAAAFGWRRFSSMSGENEQLPGHNAYEVLGVRESSTASEIKASFRRLAKETHPDVSPSSSASASRRFLLILAAYEILSDTERRAHYDSYLVSQRKVLQKQSEMGKSMYRYHSSVRIRKEIEVVEWLECYRVVIDDIVSQRKFATGSGFLDVIENDLYSAIRAAYYGPLIESMELLPDCFEAEERSAYETPEVLHLVLGRDLFGIVSLADEVRQLSSTHYEKLVSFGLMDSGICQSGKCSEDKEIPEMRIKHRSSHVSDAYKDLDLHIEGRVVATATRIYPKGFYNDNQNGDHQDLIHVFLRSSEDHVNARKEAFQDLIMPGSVGSMILLGTVKGLGTTPEEGSCFVYDRSDTKTHVIMKHRTLMVKHMHWYQIGDEVSTCECRCSRARLPPSKFWLFEPRCGMHDVGGWYIETFGRDKNGRTVPSRRQWDGTMEHHEKRLHPAIYLMALAYRTLDLEVAKRRKRTVRDVVEPKLSTILRWGKRLI